MKKIVDLIRNLRDARSGNALLLVAAGMPVLIGGSGYAVDTAQWYMWKRELQFAVDQAAYAGAIARTDELSEGTYQIRALQEYDANLAIVEGFDATPTITLADYAGGTQNSVLVTSSASKLLPFSGYIMGRAATIRVTAQASFKEGLSYNACLISLREDGTGTDIGGNAVVKAKCGLAALSCDEDAIVIDGSANVDTDSIAACGKVDSYDPELEDVIFEDVRGLVDIYADLEPPTNDTPRSYNCTGKGQNKQASLLPGTYAGGIKVACDTVFAAGIYVIDGGVLDLTHNSELIGNGVMFVLKNGATMLLGGSGNSNAINLSPPEAADFIGTPYEEQASDLAGILVFEHRDNNATKEHIFNGNSDSIVQGVIYLPDGDLRVNGTARVTSQCLQLSAYTITISGTAELETLCVPDETNSAGEALADVRLVA